MLSVLPTIFASLQSKKILILGLGREGFSTYQFLRTLFPEKILTLADEQPLSQLSSELQASIRSDLYLDTQCGNTWLENLETFDLILKSPGISPFTHPQLPDVQEKLSSNTQLFFEAVNHPEFKKNFLIKTIGITGTKGKSTTTAMVHHLLKTAGFSCLLGGNIGVPPLDLLERIAEFPRQDTIYPVLELSAHQLLNLPFSPNIAVLQNITPEHLDYYPDFTTYSQAKGGLVRSQSIEDMVIYNPSFATTAKIATLSRGDHLCFVSSASQYQQLSSAQQELITAQVKDQQLFQGSVPVTPVAELPLKGEHNLENVLPSLVIAEVLSIPSDITHQALTSFHGLPHRLEYAGSVAQVAFYNDSLATTPEAAAQALAAFPQQRLALLVGGYDRHLSYRELAEKIAQSNVKLLVLFPTTGTYLLEQLEENYPDFLQACRWINVSTMPEAFLAIQDHLASLDVVLLSPAAASFNLFVDYADRGNQFKEQVQLLKDHFTN